MKKFSSLLLAAMLSIAASQQQELSGPTNGGFNHVLKFFSDIQPMVQTADMMSKLLGGSNSQAVAPQEQSSGPSMSQVSLFASQLQSALSGGQPSTPAPGSQLLGSLTDMLRSAQESSAKAASTAGETISSSAQSVQQGTANALQTGQQGVSAAAQSAQTGIQSALMEIGQGLKRIANNNPSLIPDVKNLYENVSSKLSSASSSVSQITPGANANQIAANLSKPLAPSS